jgi:LPS sulfotransferase NodH
MDDLNANNSDWPSASGNSAQCLFVILFQGRSGSTLLGELLNSSPAIQIEGEILAGRRLEGWRRQNARLGQFVQRSQSSRIQAVGFKAKLTDIADTNAFRSFLQREGFRIVFLTRRDVVKQALSWIYADRLFQRSGEWNLVRHDIQFQPIAVKCEELVRRIRALERGRDALLDFVASLGNLPIEVNYETLQDSLESEASRVAGALGITVTSQLCATVRKHTPDDLAQAVANPEQVRACLIASGYL